MRIELPSSSRTIRRLRSLDAAKLPFERLDARSNGLSWIPYLRM
jgi:hypothetical protein